MPPCQVLKVDIRSGARLPLVNVTPTGTAAVLVYPTTVSADEKPYIYTQARASSVPFVVKGLR